jgi:hypothetical protein
MSSDGPFREAQASRLAFPVPSSRPAEHGTQGPGITISIVLVFFSLHALVPLPSLRWRHCPSCAGFCPLAMLLATHHPCRAGVFASAALVFLLASRWGWHSCCAGRHHIALVSLPLCWRQRQNCTGSFTLALASSCCIGICPSAMLQHVVVTELASCQCCAGVLARNTLASSLASAGAPIRLALVSLPYFAGVIPLGAPVSVQSQCRSRHVIVHCVVIKSVPLRQRQQAQHCWPCCPGCHLCPGQCPCCCPIGGEVVLGPSSLFTLLGPSHTRVQQGHWGWVVLPPARWPPGQCCAAGTRCTAL